MLIMNTIAPFLFLILLVISSPKAVDTPVFSDSTAIALFNRATAFYTSAEYKRAIILYRKSVDRGADPAAAAFNIGNCYFQAGDLPSALASYRRALDLSKGTSQDALLNLAAVQFRLGNFGEAIAAYRRTLIVDKSNVSVYLYLADAYQKCNDPASAQSVLEKALALTPDDISIYYQLAELHVALKEIPAAIEVIQKALLIKKDDTDLLFYLGDLYLMEKETALAIDRYREALREDPDNVSGHYRIADILVNDNQLFLAMEHLTTALSLQPGYTDAAVFLGNIAFDLQWWDRALSAYSQALNYGDAEGNVGIMNVTFELANRKNSAAARKAAALIDTTKLTNPVQLREWEEIVKLVDSQ